MALRIVPHNLDLLVESAAVQGQLAAGISPAWVAARSSLGSRAVAVFNGQLERGARTGAGTPLKGVLGTGGKSPDWSPDEDEFLRVGLGILSEETIAHRLGRTPVAVHLRWTRELKLPAPSKTPGVITGNQIADRLGIDVHSVMELIDRGILPGRRMPGKRVIRLVNQVRFIRWAVNPRNWIYFKPQRVNDPHLRRLIELRRERWDDEWWTTGKVGRYHGVNSRLVNRDILQGKLPAIRWGNWHVLRSDAIRLHYFTGKGHGHKRDWSERADAFLILAHAIGFSTNAIAAMCGWKTGAVSYRLAVLRRDLRQIRPLIRKYSLKVEYHARSGEHFANWKCYRSRFPRLARAMDHLKRGDSMSKREVLYARGILLKRARWNGDDNLVHALAGGRLSERRLRKVYSSIKKAG